MVHKADTIVERQAVGHLPVVLYVGLGVVVNEAALDVARELVVRGEGTKGGVGKAEARIQGIVSVVAEIDIAGPALTLLRLEAMGVIKTGLDCVTGEDFG